MPASRDVASNRAKYALGAVLLVVVLVSVALTIKADYDCAKRGGYLLKWAAGFGAACIDPGIEVEP